LSINARSASVLAGYTWTLDIRPGDVVCVLVIGEENAAQVRPLNGGWSGVLDLRGIQGVFVDVDAALDLVGFGPAAGARVFADLDGACATERIAANGGVALVEKGMVREIVLFEISVDFAAAHVQERRDGVAIESTIEFDEGNTLARAGLIAAEAAQPGNGPKLTHRTLKRLVLVGGAAGIDVLSPIGILFPGAAQIADRIVSGAINPDVEVEPQAQGLHVSVRLGKQIAGVHEDHLDARDCRTGHVQ